MTATLPAVDLPVAGSEELADQAAPLDALLVRATQTPLRRFLPTMSTAKFGAGLLRHPARSGRRVIDFGREIARVAAGTSSITPPKRDRRFTDAAWSTNPVLRRLLQGYLATDQAAQDLVTDADLDWRDGERVRFMVENLGQALAPSNVPLLNPASAKTAIDTAGLSLLRGARNLLGDMTSAPHVPAMVDTSGFEVGRNIAATPGAVVLRTEMLELIQYTPSTDQVRQVPLLVVPPTINKHYALDLAPGRSLVEYLVGQGQQVFMIAWRNPDARHAQWGMDAYVAAVLQALDAVERISGTHCTAVAGVCSGGIIASLAAAHLAATGRQERLAAFTLLVTVLDNAHAGTSAALIDEPTAAAAKAMSRRRGYLDGRALAEVFAWLRPGDLIWNYWVNNYLLGRRPPAFDILFWNADTIRMTAGLHADFIDIAMGNALVDPGGVNTLGTPVDLSEIHTDAYVVAGIADHITPWQNCYRSTQLLGGDTRFVLSTSGHIAALVNPPGNPRSTFQTGADSASDPQQWLASASTEQGSWWPDFAAWLGERCGPVATAPQRLGGGGLRPLTEAPGTYVFEQ
jgi:polyhydroxyalkanoate synthase